MKVNHHKIGVFIDNTLFDPIMTAFKRIGVNIEKIDQNSELQKYSCIFIDLNYPLEMGYGLISKVGRDPSLSKIDLLAIITKESDLHKVTGLQDGRISDYISFKTSFNEILKKTKFLLTPEGQPSKNYPQKRVMASVEGSMSHISESGCLVSSKVLFNSNSDVEIVSDLLTQVTEGEKGLFKVSKNIPSSKGLLFSEIDFLNLSDKSRTNIRKMIVGWSLK